MFRKVKEVVVPIATYNNQPMYNFSKDSYKFAG